MAVSSKGRARAMSIGMPAELAAADLAPRYDPRLRQLWLGGWLLKTINKPRTNQALILAAFEEEDWPELIDDPLPRDAETMPSKRLRDTLFALNRAIIAQADRRAKCLLEFHAQDGGEAIRYDLKPRRRPGLVILQGLPGSRKVRRRAVSY